MQEPKKKRPVLSILALIAMAGGGFLLADKISGHVDVKVKKTEKSLEKVNMPAKINWVSAHRASIEALDENKPILCFFTADGSTDCRKLEHEFFADKTIAEYINKNFVPVIIVDHEDLPDTATEKVVKKNYGVTQVPTLIVTDPDGKLIDQKTDCGSMTDNFAWLSRHTKLHPPDKSTPIPSARKLETETSQPAAQ